MDSGLIVKVPTRVFISQLRAQGRDGTGEGGGFARGGRRQALSRSWLFLPNAQKGKIILMSLNLLTLHLHFRLFWELGRDDR